MRGADGLTVKSSHLYLEAMEALGHVVVGDFDLVIGNIPHLNAGHQRSAGREGARGELDMQYEIPRRRSRRLLRARRSGQQRK